MLIGMAGDALIAGLVVGLYAGLLLLASCGRVFRWLDRLIFAGLAWLVEEREVGSRETEVEGQQSEPPRQATVGMTLPDERTHVVCQVRGKERYVLVFRGDQREQAWQAIGRWARHSELAFDWYAAAQMATEVGELAGASATETISQERVRLDQAPPASEEAQQPAGDAEAPTGDDIAWEPHPGLGELPRGYDEGEEGCAGK